MTRKMYGLWASLALGVSACGMEGAPQAALESAPDTESLASALSALPDAHVLDTHPDGVPTFVKGDLGSAGRGLSGASARQAHALLEPALARALPVFRLKLADVVPRDVRPDAQGNVHVRYAQVKAGLPVVGEELRVHLDASGRLYAVNGSARDGEPEPAAARIAPETALQVALTSTPGAREASPPREVFLRPTPEAALVRAFEVKVTGEEEDGTPVKDRVYVRAEDAAVVRRRSDIRTMRRREVCSWKSHLCSIEGIPAWDPSLDVPLAKLGEFYDCFNTLFARDSFDNSGAKLVATVNYMTNYANAYWDGTRLMCGDGDGVNLSSPCMDAEPVVHEFTHAITESTSNLDYAGESGALNESVSDIFTATCQSLASGTWSMGEDIWKIGEAVWTPPIAGDALRYMQDPKRDGDSLDYYPDFSPTIDPHYGSGIPNLAFKLLSTGGTHPRGRTTVNVQGIGIEKAARIMYRANTDYFVASTNFTQARFILKQVASDMGYDMSVQLAVDAAWEAVGLGTVPPPVTCTTLANDAQVTGLSGSSGSEKYFCLNVPANTPATVRIVSGSTGDADLYTRFNLAPTLTLFDCRPYLSGSNETCTLAGNLPAGTQWILLKGYSAYSGVTLSVHY
ncbi:M4 family metallopeptidase [Corallococcus sp. M34]|uniref:M4 family metallopeptidase n=1 Tax=Citreicoccus inhibens TaxID=2849499 RepID=UPI001C2372B6|nr:M4 family metallopeptidase [Citreicoccus inhibens]MBU8897167.1 M4 family metallopeptidase [Citreicoccus inhibens]